MSFIRPMMIRMAQRVTGLQEGAVQTLEDLDTLSRHTSPQQPSGAPEHASLEKVFRTTPPARER